MHDYLTFESEFERLKGYFLLEASDDDLAEKTNEKEPEEEPEEKADKGEGKEAAEKPDGKGGGTGEKDAKDKPTDLDGDSDLGEITGNPGDSPSPDAVNKESGAPGAINPKNLLRELTQGQDNVYTRVINAMKERFPGGKCVVKELLGPLEQATAHAVKAFMKNKNYAPLPRQAMKGVCDNIANTILRKCTGKDLPAGRRPAQPAGKPAANEALYYVKKSPVFESAGVLEGVMKNIALAGAIGTAGANAATAESAPYATKAPTPLFQQQQREANDKSDKEKAPATPTKGQSGVPNTKDPSSVVFNSDSTYQMTPDDYVTYKMANNLPEHYVVSGGSDDAKSGAKKPAGANTKGSEGKESGKKESDGKPAEKASGSGSATQAAVKSDAKASVGKGSPKGQATGGRCAVQQQGNQEGVGHALHRLAHKAVDKGGEIAAGVIGGIAGAARGGYRGANAGYQKAKGAIEKDHDRMIKERK